MPDPLVPPVEDFHPSEPNIGALYPDHPMPLQELPSPGENPVPITPNQTNNYSIADVLSKNDLQSLASKTYDPNFLVQPTRYNDESYDRLQKTFDNPDRNNLFSKVGFYPGANNEDKFAKSLSKWQKVGLAWDQMGGLAKETFKQQWITEASFWGNLASGQLKKAFLPFGDKEELEQMSRTMEDSVSKNYVPLTFEEQSGEFGFGKFATGLGQFGFTLGTMGAMGTQLGLELVASALLAPETEGGSVLGFGASLVNKAKRLFTLGEFYNNLRKAENTVETASKIKRAWQYMSDTHNIKAGLGTFYSFTKQWNAAAGEAKFEAGSSYTEFLDAKYKEAKDAGKFLTLEERTTNEDKAAKVAMNNGITNTGLLYIMNRINMNNVFKGPFSAQRRFLIELGEGADKALVKTAKGWVPRTALTGLFSKDGAMGLGKGLVHWTIDSAWEGVQEVAQGVSNKYWQSYYGEQYDRKPNFNAMSLLGKSISARLDSNESFDEFISGFIIGLPGSAINMGIGSIHRNIISRDQTAQYKKQVSNLADELNKWEADPTRVFDARVANANNQVLFSQEMKEAVETDDIYAYKNLNNQNMRDMIMLGIRTGKLEYMLDTLKDQVKNLKPEEFEALFKVTADSTNKKAAIDYVSLLESKAEQMVKDYDQAKQKHANPFTSFSKYKPGSPEETTAKIKYVAWENAVQDLVFQKDTYTNVSKRMADILSETTQTLGSALHNHFFTLTSTDNILRESLLLKEEIKSLSANQTIDDATKKIIEQKQKQLAGLEKWSKSHSLIGSFLEKRMDFVSSLAEHTDEARSAFEEVMQAYQSATEGAEVLTSEQIDKAYKSIIDYARLNNDNKVTVANISLLTSPEGFSEHFDRHFIEADSFYKKEMAERYSKLQSKYALNSIMDHEDSILQGMGYSNTPADANEKLFVLQPNVKSLRARIDQAINDRDFEDIEKLYDELLDEYTKFFGPEKPVAEEEKTITHTVRKEADGTFSVISPEGEVVKSGYVTEDEAYTIASQLDEAMGKQPAGPTVSPVNAPQQSGPPPEQSTTPAIYRIYKNSIDRANTPTKLNTVAGQIEKDGIKKGLTVDQVAELQTMIQEKMKDLAKNQTENDAKIQKVMDDILNKINNAYTKDDIKKIGVELFGTGIGKSKTPGIFNILNDLGATQEDITKIEEALTQRNDEIQNGTVQAPSKMTVVEMSDKIKSTTKDSISSMKEEVEKNFTGKEKEDLLEQVLEKMNKFAEEQKQEEEENMKDTYNVDEFDPNDFKDDLDDFASTIETPEKTEEKTEEEPTPSTEKTDLEKTRDDLFSDPTICE
jgi:hypothetical protein